MLAIRERLHAAKTHDREVENQSDVGSCSPATNEGLRLTKKNPHNSKTPVSREVLSVEGTTAGSDTTNRNNSGPSSKVHVSPMLAAVLSCTTSSSSDSDSRDSKIRNVKAAPSGKTTMTKTRVKCSEPSTLFKRLGDIVCLREF